MATRHQDRPLPPLENPYAEIGEQLSGKKFQNENPPTPNTTYDRLTFAGKQSPYLSAGKSSNKTRPLVAVLISFCVVLLLIAVALGVYVGLFARANSCSNKPCQHDESCYVGTGGYKCFPRDPGHGGIGCKQEINECASGPCGNNGTCYHNLDGFICLCMTGFAGHRCETDMCGSNPCQHGGVCQHETNGYNCSCPAGYIGGHCEERAVDCGTYYNKGMRSDGVYTIAPAGSAPFAVYCEFQGPISWTVIQRRQDGSVTFDRNWADYKNGFGNLTGEFWLGNENMYHLSNQATYRLRIDGTLLDGTTRWGEYRFFRISDETQKYKLTLSGLTGDPNTTGSVHGWFARQNHMNFTTHDRDYDASPTDNCAVKYLSGWWHKDCYSVCLNCPYGRSACTYTRCIQWSREGDTHLWAKSTSMKITRVQF